MRTPPLLKESDKVGIVAPAGRVDKDMILNNLNLISEWGLVPVIGKHTFSHHHLFSGTDAERLEDVQNMLDDTDVKAIFFARGGYGSIRIIDKLDFTVFSKNPKWLVGFSDITIFHSFVNKKLKIKTIHAPVVNSLVNGRSLTRLKNCLFCGNFDYEILNNNLNINGNAEGELIGGNLSIIYSLLGVDFGYDFKNKILVVEDVNEYDYNIDRMMKSVMLSGKLQELKGLIVGDFRQVKVGKYEFGKTVNEIIFDIVKDYGFPVAFNAPVGHTKINDAFIVGSKAKLSVTNKGSRLMAKN